MDEARTALLIAATITYGVAAGVHQLYVFVIMPALGKTDDRTFVGAYQEIDRTIVGPYLVVFFVGPIVLTGLATFFHLGAGQRGDLPWIAVSFGLGLAVLVVTMVVHVPLNDAIKAAGHPDQIDAGAERVRFSESKWVKWHRLRVIFSTAGFMCLVWALN